MNVIDLNEGTRPPDESSIYYYKNQNRRLYLERTYGMTTEEYDKRLISQNGVCAICKKDEKKIHPKTKKLQPLSVDHNHETGKVRGLLCQKCNTLLGLCKDSTEILSSAIQYLTQPF